MSRRIRVKNPNAIHETIEGKVINIDLETSYYSLRDTSAEIWQGIESGADELQIADSLHRRCDASHETIGAAVGTLLDELAAEGLIGPGDGNSAAAPGAPPSGSDRARVALRTYAREAHGHAGTDPARPGPQGRSPGLAACRRVRGR